MAITTSHPGPSPSPVTGVDAPAAPAPAFEHFDEHGRRVCTMFESATDLPREPASGCWLVAVDGSANSMHALAAAFRLATQGNVHTIDLVNVQPWMSKEAAQVELVQRGWTSTAAARAWLDAHRFGWRLHVWMGEPAARIVEQAESLSSVGVAIGARGLSATEGLLLGSIVQQVLHRTRGAVLVVR